MEGKRGGGIFFPKLAICPHSKDVSLLGKWAMAFFPRFFPNSRSRGNIARLKVKYETKTSTKNTVNSVHGPA